MDRLALHKIWTPEAGPWSDWVKPVPFAFWPRPLESTPVRLRAGISPSLFPRADEHCAVVIDLPGAESIHCGILLAGLGYQPVPVFAACPASEDSHGLHPCAVDVEGTIAALAETAPFLSTLHFSDSSPPAFLIDASRRATTYSTIEGYFDNRSAIFPSDFPSSETLRRRGIEKVRIVRDEGIASTPDLAFAFNHWRQQGIEIDAITDRGNPTQISWPKDGRLARLLHHLDLFLSLRTNDAGGYGQFVPKSSGG